MQPVDQCIAINAGGNFSQLDMDLAYKARVIQETMTVWLSVDILDSLDLTGWNVGEEILRTCGPCTPMDSTRWGDWSAWTCSVGPFYISNGQCLYENCTRTRTGRRVVITEACAFIRTFPTQTQTEPEITVPQVDGVCPNSP